jgi:hypothetical protein
MSQIGHKNVIKNTLFFELQSLPHDVEKTQKQGHMIK